MKQIFPAVHMVTDGNTHEAVAGLALNWMLKADLVEHPGAGNESGGPGGLRHFLKERREALLHSLAEMPPGICLELHIVSNSDLAVFSRGRVEVFLFIRSRGKDGDQLRERLLSFFISLKSTLASHLVGAEFKPMADPDELLSAWNGDGAEANGFAIRRRRETLTLGEPLKQLVVGFGAAPRPGKVNEPLAVNHIYPWLPSFDDWGLLLRAMLEQFDPLRIIARLTPCTLNSRTRARLTDTLRVCDSFLADNGGRENTLTIQANLIREITLQQLARLSEHGFRTGVYLLGPSGPDRSLASMLGRVVSGRHPESHRDQLFSGGFEMVRKTGSTIRRAGYFVDPEPLSLTEAACAFRLPSPPATEIPGLPLRRFRTGPALVPVKPGGSALAINEHQGRTQEVTLGVEERMHHVFIIGQTGTGKSTLMERMILTDIRAGRGVAVIDPHGDMVDSLAGRIPHKRVRDVILFDLLDRERPLGFNLLAWRTSEERDLIIDDLFQSLDRIYDMKQVGGPMFENNFRGMLKLLMGDRPRPGFVPTLLEFVRCYQDADFRAHLKKTITDPVTLDFVRELEKTGGEASLRNIAPYITSKLGRFVHDPGLQRIVGQERSAINFEEIMDQSRILLMKLGRGRFGSAVSGLLVGQMVSRFRLAAMKRGATSPDRRRDFFLYVDEAHSVPSRNFCELLAEARKYRLGLVLATQYGAQLTRESLGGRDDLLAAVTGNVGTSVIFRLGREDAGKTGDILYPTFREEDILTLPKWHGYISNRTGIDSIPPFSFRTIKDDAPFSRDTSERIQTCSREKYGRAAVEIDQEILERRNIKEVYVHE